MTALILKMRKALCCCEYIDEEGDRNHILACCCNCSEIDFCFDRLITCKRIPRRTYSKIMTTISDRLRLPWKNGAVKLSLDTVSPVILLPLTLFGATISVWVSVVIFAFLPIFLMYSHYFYMKCRSHTNFFLSWAVTSIVLVFLVFETIGMRLLDIRFEENIIFMILSGFVLFCLFRVKQRAILSIAVVENTYGDQMVGVCSICNIKVPERAFHCHICEGCVLLRDQHCAWLNCCIGKSNHRWYLLLLMTSVSMMLLSSNLILTTVCHPFKVWTTGVVIMLPDDCTDVYYDVVYTVGFVTAIYCLQAVAFLSVLLLHELLLISLGMTGHEWRNFTLGSNGNRRSCIRFSCSNPYSRGFISNWANYLRGFDNPSIPHTI